MRPAQLEEMLEVASAAAREAGGFLLTQQTTEMDVRKKGRTDLVTESDLRAEELIVGAIHDRFPNHSILAEETGAIEEGSAVKWLIDPIDGTTNYAHGYRFFCVSIAVEIEGEVAVGLVYDPVVDECFSAIRGQGARLNGRPIRVSSRSELIDSMLATGFSYQADELRANLVLFNRLVPETRAVRRDGSAALDLCYVACGRFDGFWEVGLKPWDVAAGLLLVEEAGGQVSRFDGSPCSIYERQFLATNGRIHDDVGSRLLDCMDPSALREP